MVLVFLWHRLSKRRDTGVHRDVFWWIQKTPVNHLFTGVFSAIPASVFLTQLNPMNTQPIVVTESFSRPHRTWVIHHRCLVENLLSLIVKHIGLSVLGCSRFLSIQDAMIGGQHLSGFQRHFHNMLIKECPRCFNWVFFHNKDVHDCSPMYSCE